MSAFKTTVPHELKAFFAALPKGSHIDGFGQSCFDERTGKLDPEGELYVLWQNDAWESGLTIPVDYPLELLVRNKLPRGLLKRSEHRKRVEAAQAPKNAPESQPEAKAMPLPTYLTEQEVAEAIAKGEKLEFWGVQPHWQTANPSNHRYIEGYKYRKVVLAPEPELVEK